MKEPTLTITSKEIFYTALMLGGERIIGIEYRSPTDEAVLAKEFNEAKRSLHKRKLLRENSKGEIQLTDELAAVAAFCVMPDECAVIDESKPEGVIYKVGISSLFLEKTGDGNYSAYIFTDENMLSEYMENRMRDGGDTGTSIEEAASDG